ncbi:hypothetical protein ACFQX6_32510 [Streptosporangium lutulentum]
MWRHGDWIKFLPDGGCVIYGRSDSTLNRGGVRMGTSEFYRVVERFEEIADSLVIDTGQLGQEGRLLLYVTMAPGSALTDELITRLRGDLREALSPATCRTRSSRFPASPGPSAARSWRSPSARSSSASPGEGRQPRRHGQPRGPVALRPGRLTWCGCPLRAATGNRRTNMAAAIAQSLRRLSRSGLEVGHHVQCPAQGDNVGA